MLPEAQKTLKKDQTQPKTGIAEKIPYRNPVKIPHSYPLKGAVMYFETRLVHDPV